MTTSTLDRLGTGETCGACGEELVLEVTTDNQFELGCGCSCAAALCP